jgi:D-alanyl-D-alanine carboxypeptidase/D-alanyl-D-alanine-endopeptidase (penicillin-binding protein 4)
LLKALGTMRPESETDEPGGSAANGIAVAARTWVSAGIDTSTVRIVDGSGLSRYNLVSPTATTRLLTYMWSRPEPTRSVFLDSLPVGGVDGTLAGRYPSGRARGLVRAKTGTVSNVSTLSGYLETLRGTPLAFSLMSNNFVVDTDEMREIQDLIVGWLAAIDDL